MQVWLTTPKILVTTTLLALLFCACVVSASAGVVAQADTRSHAPPIASSDFGMPPSGEIPILYNDHTVYTKPDILRKSRVLAAFIKGHVIYVPLRSMFEQMGATVTASDDGLTFTATKPGTTVSVRLGSSDVTINGETRPLDVPPILYKGVVLVPVRVISEALGAYVLWVSDRHLVVVHYIPATPPPPPTAAPTIAPPVATPTPTPLPLPASYTAFIQAAASDSKNYNEFANGADCPQSYLFSGVYRFRGSPLAIKLDLRHDAYVSSDNLTFFGNHYTQFSTIDGGAAFTPVFLAKQDAFDARVEFQVAAPLIYVGAGYLQTATNYGYPHLSGFGFGVEKLPDMRKGFNLQGSAFYYPSASGNFTVAAAGPNASKTYRQQYAITKYDAGLTLVLGNSPVYLYGGFSGMRYTVKQNAPVGQSHNGPYIGLGLKL